MADENNLLNEDHSEIKLVPAGARDVWTRRTPERCHFSDGRGRCTSRQTRPYWNASDGLRESYCEKHYPLSEDTRASGPESGGK